MRLPNAFELACCSTVLLFAGVCCTGPATSAWPIVSLPGAALTLGLIGLATVGILLATVLWWCGGAEE